MFILRFDPIYNRKSATVADYSQALFARTNPAAELRRYRVPIFLSILRETGFQLT